MRVLAEFSVTMSGSVTMDIDDVALREWAGDDAELTPELIKEFIDAGRDFDPNEYLEELEYAAQDQINRTSSVQLDRVVIYE